MCFKAFAFRSKHDEELASLLTGHSCKCEAITSHVLTSPFDELALNEATSVKMYIRISLQQLPAHCRSRAMVSIALVIINMDLEILQLLVSTTNSYSTRGQISGIHQRNNIRRICLRTLIQHDAIVEPPRKRQKKVFEANS